MGALGSPDESLRSPLGTKKKFREKQLSIYLVISSFLIVPKGFKRFMHHQSAAEKIQIDLVTGQSTIPNYPKTSMFLIS